MLCGVEAKNVEAKMRCMMSVGVAGSDGEGLWGVKCAVARPDRNDKGNICSILFAIRERSHEVADNAVRTKGTVHNQNTVGHFRLRLRVRALRLIVRFNCGYNRAKSKAIISTPYDSL